MSGSVIERIARTRLHVQTRGKTFATQMVIVIVIVVVVVVAPVHPSRVAYGNWLASPDRVIGHTVIPKAVGDTVANKDIIILLLLIFIVILPAVGVVVGVVDVIRGVALVDNVVFDAADATRGGRVGTVSPDGPIGRRSNLIKVVRIIIFRVSVVSVVVVLAVAQLLRHRRGGGQGGKLHRLVGTLVERERARTEIGRRAIGHIAAVPATGRRWRAWRHDRR